MISPFTVASCRECGLQSAGRCPTCHRELCVDHFPCENHEPCATHLRKHASEYVCYVCGDPAVPQQWSSAVFAHYVDLHQCAGCKRPICDERHTSVIGEDVVISRDGMRSHRYHVTHRYCDLCAPVRSLGGIIGATRWLVGVGGTIMAAALIYLEVLR
jgi:hypothetical protein